MTLFIIGNGFDIQHHLPTMYWDFRTYLDNLHHDFLSEFENHYSIYSSDTIEYKKNVLWNDFETRLANINDDVIIEDALGIDMGLESGDIGIEETLYDYFSAEYKYIEMLAIYLKQWIRTIKIRDVQPLTSKINSNDSNVFITFNYTSTLENVYKIPSSNITHIHGSLHQYTDNPILGHGNTKRIHDIENKTKIAEEELNEKELSIYKVVRDYYNSTYKNVNKYMYKLQFLTEKIIDNIIVIGHSVAGIDLSYFQRIEQLTMRRSFWNVYFYKASDEMMIKHALRSCGIEDNRILLEQSNKFFDLTR